MLVEVIKAYEAQYKDPISFERGVTVQVLREDSEFPHWFWCRAPSGKEGWVHRSFLAEAAATTKSTRPYSARELTVNGDESGTCAGKRRVLATSRYSLQQPTAKLRSRQSP